MTDGGIPVANGWWADLPTARVTPVDGATMDGILVALDPLPETASPVIAYQPGVAASGPDQVGLILDQLEQAALSLFPAWLSGAEHIAGPQGGGVAAVRALAIERAATTRHFGPFIAALAECALRGQRLPVGSFAAAVRMAGLARVIADSYGRRDAVLLIDVPAALTDQAEQRLVAAAEWVAQHGGIGVWLVGEPLRAVDRISTVALDLGEVLVARTGQWPVAEPEQAEPQPLPQPMPQPPVTRIPPIAGKPRSDSRAEQALEAALSTREWAAHRRWNQTYHADLLAIPFRLDLWWKAERCVIEVDGPEHHEPVHYAADRRRDAHLLLDGYAVLRYTNEQILDDVHRVTSEIERLVLSRRQHTLEKQR